MHNVIVSPPHLTEMLDSAPAGVLVAAEDGRILYANAALVRLFGHEAKALLRMRVEDLLPARYRGTHEGFRAGFFERPQPRVMGEGRELFALHALGHEFPIEIGLGSIMREGEPCAIAFVSDVSRRLAVEKQFAGIVHALPLGLLMEIGRAHV